MAASKKKRARSKAVTAKAPKRRRISKARASKALEDKRLPFPAAVLALPHVLELIDAFRMTPAEAAQHAAATGQSEWLGQLISSYGSSVTSQDMLVDAAAKGYEEVVKQLLPELSSWRQESCEVVLLAVEAAGANARYSTLKILLPELDSVFTDNEKGGKVVGKVLDDAAERGCLDAVMAIMSIAEREIRKSYCQELQRAVSSHCWRPHGRDRVHTETHKLPLGMGSAPRGCYCCGNEAASNRTEDFR
jgi:hypothetical protein